MISYVVIFVSSFILLVIYALIQDAKNDSSTAKTKDKKAHCEKILISYSQSLSVGEVRSISDLKYSKEEIEAAFRAILESDYKSDFKDYASDKLEIMYTNLDTFIEDENAKLIGSILSLQKSGTALSTEQKSVLEAHRHSLISSFNKRKQEFYSMR